MTVQDWFASKLSERGLSPDKGQLERFGQYYEMLVEWNERINLTAITEREQVYAKHFYDSLTISFVLPVQQMQTVADIGSGAGFPGLPLKIMFPHLRLTIVDSLRKRIHFLEHVVSSLGLQDVVCIHGRAEDLGRQRGLRDRFDLVTARAVARLPVLNELCLPFVRPGGLFVAMKGAQGEEELAEAEKSIRLLRARVDSVHRFQLPIDDAERRLIVLEKTGATPGKYPRKPGIPVKQPL